MRKDLQIINVTPYKKGNIVTNGRNDTANKLKPDRIIPTENNI